MLCQAFGGIKIWAAFKTAVANNDTGMVLSIGQEVEALHAFLMHFLDSNVGHTFGIELEVGGLAVLLFIVKLVLEQTFRSLSYRND